MCLNSIKKNGLHPNVLVYGLIRQLELFKFSAMYARATQCADLNGYEV